jgi:hypothetical protein
VEANATPVSKKVKAKMKQCAEPNAQQIIERTNAFLK